VYSISGRLCSMTRVGGAYISLSCVPAPLSSLPPMPDMSAIANPQQRSFNPYVENGGTILAVAGADFTVIAGDTRQSEGYSIQTRYAPKVFRLYACHPTSNCSASCSRVSFRTDRAVLAVNGFAADGNMFVKKVKQRLEVLGPLSPSWGRRSFRCSSGIDMPTQKTCRCARLHVSSKRCCTHDASSHTMFTTYSGALRKMVSSLGLYEAVPHFRIQVLAPFTRLIP
jgi:hypothetical protein